MTARKEPKTGRRFQLKDQLLLTEELCNTVIEQVDRKAKKAEKGQEEVEGRRTSGRRLYR